MEKKLFFFLLLISLSKAAEEEEQEKKTSRELELDCAQELLPGQFLCFPPEIDDNSQQPKNCRGNIAKDAIKCEAVDGLKCSGSGNGTFFKDASCKETNGYNLETCLLLSVFLGMFGLDRFYLGYPALGLLKFATLGFFFIGHLLDVVLIASGVVGPADGSAFVVPYYGPAVEIVSRNNLTQIRPEIDWYT